MMMKETAMQPYVGMPVLYRWRPGQVRAGQVDDAAVVTRVYEDGAVNLTVFPDGVREWVCQQRVPPMHPVLQGDMPTVPPREVIRDPAVTGHCWHLHSMSQYLSSDRATDSTANQALEARIAALENRRPPGRPRKPPPETIVAPPNAAADC